MRLSTLTLTSRDLLRSRAFHTMKLGFKLIDELSGKCFVVDAGGVNLRIDAEGARSPLAAAEPRLVFESKGLAERCMLLRDLGVSVEGPRNGRAELSDPDGHPITLVEMN